MISYFHCRLLALIASIVFLFDGVQATRDQDQLELVRNEYGDYFENVFSSGPTDTNETFCRSLNAFCMNKYPSKDDKCRYCQCSGLANTYVEQRAQCEQTEAVKKGCILQFYKGNNYYVNVINIDDDGKLELLIPGLVKHNHIKKCVVENVAQMTPNGYNKVTKTLFEVDKTDDGKKKVKIEWDELEKSYGGRLYRINITCEMEKHEAGGPREKYTMTQCVVLKTRGRISIKNPSLPISPTQLSTTVTWTTGDPTTTEHTSSEAPVTEAPTTPTTKAPTKAPTKGHRTTGELMTTMMRTTLEVHPSTKKVASQARTVETTVTSTLELIPSDLISRSTKGSSLRTSAGEGGPAKNEKLASKKSETTVVYLSVAVVVVAVVIILGSLYVFRAKIQKKMEKLFGNRKRDFDNSNFVKDQPVYETPDQIGMHMVENAYDGVYTYADNQEMSKSRLGIENEIFVGASDVNEYTSLDDCRKGNAAIATATDYQSLISPRTEPTNDDATYLTVLPEQEQRVYSVLEEARDQTASNDNNDDIAYVIPAQVSNNRRDGVDNKKPFEDHDYVVLTR